MAVVVVVVRNWFASAFISPLLRAAGVKVNRPRNAADVLTLIGVLNKKIEVLY
jgi:hypothetical protein